VERRGARRGPRRRVPVRTRLPPEGCGIAQRRSRARPVCLRSGRKIARLRQEVARCIRATSSREVFTNETASCDRDAERNAPRSSRA
jgi:hypothetical protein